MLTGMAVESMPLPKKRKELDMFDPSLFLQLYFQCKDKQNGYVSGFL